MREQRARDRWDGSAGISDFDECKLWRGELGPFVAKELAEK